MISPDAERCGLCFLPPDGPSTPFATTGLIAIDVARVVILLGVLAIVALAVPATWHATSPGQRVRMLAMIPIAVVVATIQLEHLGDHTSWRLPLALLGVWFGAYGLWLFVRYERPGAACRLVEREERRREKRRQRERTELGRHRR